MSKFRKKPVVIEAITFEELVQHGRDNGGNIVAGMPWSFEYAGHGITHENDDCYLIPTKEGTMRMGRTDMLITGIKGEIYPCDQEIFAATYDDVIVNGAQNDSAIPPAFAALKEAMVADPSYAHSWHCNVAMPIHDEGVDIKTANKAASRIMKHLFGVDTSEDMLAKA